jgi:membrane fusion protein
MIAGPVDKHDHLSLPVFREEVLQARSWMGRITLSELGSSWLLTLLAFAFAVAVLVFLFVATYTRHESVQGQLVPSSGLLPVTARSAGTVMRTLVREGESVKKDQSLIELSGEVSSLSRGQTQGSVIVDLQAQLKEIDDLLANQKRLEHQ